MEMTVIHLKSACSLWRHFLSAAKYSKNECCHVTAKPFLRSGFLFSFWKVQYIFKKQKQTNTVAEDGKLENDHVDFKDSELRRLCLRPD